MTQYAWRVPKNQEKMFLENVAMAKKLKPIMAWRTPISDMHGMSHWMPIGRKAELTEAACGKWVNAQYATDDLLANQCSACKRKVAMMEAENANLPASP